MRKKTINILSERIIWGLILILPLVAWVVSFFSFHIGGGSDTTGLSPLTFNEVLANFGINTNNVVYTTLDGIFGANSNIINFFNIDSALLLYLTYFCIVEIMHLFVDFIIFIPRLCSKWFDKISGVQHE